MINSLRRNGRLIFPPAKARSAVIRAEWYVSDKKYGFETEYTPTQVVVRPLEDLISSFCFYANQEIERLINKDNEKDDNHD